jgi:demethylmenaquinone methyltransferase/2-methoxy-6-polyprenyl-1,4-benzoquinol methylase
MTDRIVDQAMRGYYDARAAEYDDWWLGTGLFAERDRPGWDDEVERLVDTIRALRPARTLDVACGTGFLTRELPGDVVALDQSASMLEVAAARMPHARVVQGDAVPLPFADAEFGRVFTSHFYGHLLPDEGELFLAEARRVGRELVIADAALRDGVEPEQWQERVLNDGSRHRVYKRFFTGAGLAEELGRAEILHEGRWFVLVAAGQV